MDNATVVDVWADRGITWAAGEEVSKRYGPNDSDKRVLGTAQIPVVTDLDKFRKAYGDACVLGIMDGTSLRVMAQDVNRSGLVKGLSAEEIRSRIHLRLKGIRNSSVATVKTVTVKVYALPGGGQYAGTDLVEYQQAYVAALVDLGTPAEVATTVAASITF